MVSVKAPPFTRGFSVFGYLLAFFVAVFYFEEGLQVLRSRCFALGSFLMLF